MDYRIIKAVSDTGQIEVVYSNEGVDIASFAVDVPIINGVYLTGEALDAEIRHRAPTWLLEREQDIKTATGFEHILALVPEVEPTTQETDSVANANMWAQVQFEKQVAKALVKFGVLQSDPSTIETTQL